jgi:hypothetical protein
LAVNLVPRYRWIQTILVQAAGQDKKLNAVFTSQRRNNRAARGN